MSRPWRGRLQGFRRPTGVAFAGRRSIYPALRFRILLLKCDAVAETFSARRSRSNSPAFFLSGPMPSSPGSNRRRKCIDWRRRASKKDRQEAWRIRIPSLIYTRFPSTRSCASLGLARFEKRDQLKECARQSAHQADQPDGRQKSKVHYRRGCYRRDCFEGSAARVNASVAQAVPAVEMN